MSETATGDGLEDAISIREVGDGRWAWIDEAYDGVGTRVVEWIELTNLAGVVVHVDGVEHFQLNDNEFDGEDGFLSETRWIESSQWYDLDEMR